MPVDPLILTNIIQFAIGFGMVFLVVVWLSLILWTFRDIRRRTRDPLIRILSVIVSAVLFIPGALIYLLLRPPLTLEEEYQKNLEEEALMQSLDEIALCPGCSRRIQPDWMVCPSCRTKLKKKCTHCGKAIDQSWDICPFCEAPAAGFHRTTTGLDQIVTQTIHNTTAEKPELD